ncbi:MAG TPA: hypothetical protein VGN00_17890 [Puia sp.]|jgi:hypothetical protein
MENKSTFATLTLQKETIIKLRQQNNSSRIKGNGHGLSIATKPTAVSADVCTTTTISGGMATFY